jgi:O-antigen/teichoic acid export membrane protein
MANKETSLINNILYYSSSQYVRQLLSVITAFIRPALLGPTLFGLWNLFKVIETYADYLHLGSFSAMKYQVPLYRSQNNHTMVNAIISSVFRGSFYIYLVFSLLLMACSFLPNIALESKAGFVCFSVVVLLIWFNNFHIVLLKGQGRFIDISKLNYIYYITAFILSIVLVYFFGIYGAYLSLLIPLFLVVFLLKRSFKHLKIGSFQKTVFFSMIKDGFPIMLFDTSAFFIRTCDRFIVAFFLGTAQLGHYGIAILILGFLLNIPGASRDVLDTQMMKSISQTSEQKILQDYFITPLINTAYFMPIIIGTAYFSLPLFISLLLPEYSQGLLPAQIITLGGYFIALSYTARGIIVANKWHNHAPLAMILPIVVNLVVSYLLINAGYGISGVAMASTLSYFVLVLCLFLFICVKQRSIGQLLYKNMRSLWLPLLVLSGLIYLIECSFMWLNLQSYFSLLLKMILFLMLYAMLLYMTKDKHSLLRRFNFKLANKLCNKQDNN